MAKVNLWRKLIDSDIFLRPQRLRVFLTLLLGASPNPRDVRLKNGAGMIHLERGDGFTSKAKLARKLSYYDKHGRLIEPSIQNLDHHLRQLASGEDPAISISPSLWGFQYSIIKYNDYNHNGKAPSTAISTPQSRRFEQIDRYIKHFPHLDPSEAELILDMDKKLSELRSKAMEEKGLGNFDKFEELVDKHRRIEEDREKLLYPDG